MKKIVQCTQLGNSGRFGNWLIQYAFCRRYAEENDAELQTPDWAGDELFQLDDQAITNPVPVTPLCEVKPKMDADVINLDMFFSRPTDEVIDGVTTRKLFQRIFVWSKEHVLGVPRYGWVGHLREGDFLIRKDLPQVSRAAMLKSMSEHVPAGKEAILISENNRSRLQLKAGKFDFLYDFQLLVFASNLFVYPWSTFSYCAALMGTGNVYMPYDFTQGPTKVKHRLENIP